MLPIYRSSALFYGLPVPDGWQYAWKRKTVKNWEWDGQLRELTANGWRLVPASRHDGRMMPRGHYGHIESCGFVLMERRKSVISENTDVDCIRPHAEDERIPALP